MSKYIITVNNTPPGSIYLKRRFWELGTAEDSKGLAFIFGPDATFAQRVIDLLNKSEETCPWQEDEDGIWTGACSITWQFLDEDTPAQNDMTYCPKCGKTLHAIPYQEPTDEDHE